MKKANMNLSIGFYEQNEYIYNALKLCEKYSINYLIKDNCFHKGNISEHEFKELKNKATDYKSFLGFSAFDEPSIKEFDKLVEMKNIFGLDDKLFYVNLQPIYSKTYYLVNGMWTKETNDNINYDSYLEEYVKKINPSLLSFDFYPFEKEGVKKEYFIQLEKFTRFNLPVWHYIQSCTWCESEARIPNYNEMLWQINCSLAFGVSGIIYFCFWTPYSNAERNNNVAIIDFYGEPTKRYFYIKKIHNKIKKHIKILKKLNYIGVCYFGNSICTKTEQTVIDDLFVEGDVVVGVFEDDKQQKYFYIVSNSIENKSKDITIKYKFNQLSLRLEGGEAKIINIHKNKRRLKCLKD